MAGRRNIWHALDVNRYRVGAHTRHRLIYHLVWIPKYRKRVLLGKVAIRLRGLLYEAAEVNNWWIQELNIQLDHVHVMIQLPADVSVAQAMQVLKGGTSRVLRRECPELEEFLWGESLWSDGYFAESVGVVKEETMRRYIREQKHGQSMPKT